MRHLKLITTMLLLMFGMSAIAQQWIPLMAGPTDPISRTGLINVSPIAHMGVGQFEINGISVPGPNWDAYLFNGAGAGQVLRVKGGWKGNSQPLFQVEANNDDPNDNISVSNVRFNVLANGNCGVGDIATPTNRLVVTDDQANAGFAKLSNYNNENNSQWWLGFTRGAVTDDNADITRIGTKSVTESLSGTQTGKLFFRTGVNIPGFTGNNTMWLDELGRLGMGWENPSAVIDINANNYNLNTTWALRVYGTIDEQTNATIYNWGSLAVPTLMDPVGLEVNRTDAKDRGIGIFTYGNHYGIYAGVYNPGGSVTAYAGYFNGDVITTGSYWPSDFKLKKNVNNLSSALDKIAMLHPKTYQYRTDEFKSMNLREGENMGFIAEELEQVFPNLVKKTIHPATKDEKEVEFKAVDYISLIPVLTAGIQEQQQQIEEKESEIAELKKEIKALAARIDQLAGTTNTGKVNGSNINAYLEQNSPNPFTDRTTINYFIPETIQGQTTIIIYNANGSVIERYDVAKGKGQLNIEANALPAGSYLYELQVNGQRIDTKKMVLTK